VQSCDKQIKSEGKQYRDDDDDQHVDNNNNNNNNKSFIKNRSYN
jgi:hypothetical protein